jgi:hypothetical protein
MTEAPLDDEPKPSYIVMQDGHAMPYSVRTMFEYDLAKLEILYKNTRNPIFAWEAVLLNCSPLVERIRNEADSNWPPFSPAMPKWCMDYLESCGTAARSLAYGLSPELPGYDPNLTPTGCADMIARRFGFTRPGWNAFNEHRTFGESADMNAMMSYMRADGGATAQEAIDRALEKYGLANERSVRKRIKALRTLFSPKARRSKGEVETPA